MNNIDFNALFISTEELTAEGKLDEAAQNLQQLIELQNRVKARAYNDLGVIAFQQGELEKSLEYYQTAVKLAPEDTTFRKNLADLLYFRCGDTDAALAHYRQVLQINPRDFDANLAIGHICAELGRHFLNEAETFFAVAKEIEPDNQMVNDERNRLRQSSPPTPKSDGTKSTISQPVSESTDPETAYADLSQNFNPDDPAATEMLLKDFLRRYPDFALACNDLGVISYQLEKLDEAGHFYRKAVELAPDNITFRKNLADFIFVVEQDPETAMSHYNQILRSTPQDIETLLMVGNLCLSQGLQEDARTFFDLVLQIEPWNLEASQAIELFEQTDATDKGTENEKTTKKEKA